MTSRYVTPDGELEVRMRGHSVSGPLIASPENRPLSKTTPISSIDLVLVETPTRQSDITTKLLLLAT